jgi:hypothetical protein
VLEALVAVNPIRSFRGDCVAAVTSSKKRYRYPPLNADYPMFDRLSI